jgi:hypothetical protein
LNLIERWFAEITNKRIRRGSWASVKKLEKAILEYICLDEECRPNPLEHQKGNEGLSRGIFTKN